MKTKIWLLLTLCLITLHVMAEEGPADARRHMIRGVAAIEMAKNNAELTLAADEFVRATELDPSLSAAWYNLGSVQSKLSQFDAAIESYKRYLTLVPKAEDAQKVRDEIVKLEFRQELVTKMSPVMVHIPGKNYELGKYEVTQYQWRAVMGNNPSKFTSCGDTCPVEQVSWNDIQEYLQKLNAMTGRQYRLPNKAEWEYACYGGSQTEYCGSNDINAVAWYPENSNSSTHPVGQKQANGYGLYDMSGNVYEWMGDTASNELGYLTHGGSWATSARSARAVNDLGVTTYGGATLRDNYLGFRLASPAPSAVSAPAVQSAPATPAPANLSAGTYQAKRSYGNGDTYVGEFRAGQINGKGVYQFANGNRYEGEFRDNNIQGNGVFTCANGKTIPGPFSKLQPQGLVMGCD